MMLDIEKIPKLKKQLSSDGTLFFYNGYLSHAIVEELCDITHRKLEQETSVTVREKIFSILVEELQNIMSYSAEKSSIISLNGELKNGIIILVRKNGQFSVISGNLIEKKQEDSLRKRLETISKLDKEGLKELYKQQRKKPFASNEKGAGLGFIDMARKSTLPIKYFIQDFSKGYSFFCLQVTI